MTKMSYYNGRMKEQRYQNIDFIPINKLLGVRYIKPTLRLQALRNNHINPLKTTTKHKCPLNLRQKTRIIYFASALIVSLSLETLCAVYSPLDSDDDNV